MGTFGSRRALEEPESAGLKAEEARLKQGPEACWETSVPLHITQVTGGYQAILGLERPGARLHSTLINTDISLLPSCWLQTGIRTIYSLKCKQGGRSWGFCSNKKKISLTDRLQAHTHTHTPCAETQKVCLGLSTHIHTQVRFSPNMNNEINWLPLL